MNTYASSSAFAGGNIVLEIDGKAIAYALQDQSMSGNNTSVNRTRGSFE
jgi:hypothetical protein